MPRTSEEKSANYIEAVGRRKTATARVRLTEASKTQVTVNEKAFEDYVQEASHRVIVREALEKGSPDKHFIVTIRVIGGGPHAQAEAIRHGVANALVKMDPELRTNLKALGFLTRDPRMRERKKFGLKRARRARQWRKR